VIDAIDETSQEECLGGQCAIGFELADPVTVRSLVRDEIVLRASDCLVESRHDAKW